MIGLMMQAGSAGISDILVQLENAGFFQYVLPFLLIFGASYAILTQIPTFDENKGAAGVVALAMGLLALQLNFVPAFFQDIFPKFGVGLAFLLVALILAGAFIPSLSEGGDAYRWIFFGVGAIIFLVILFSSLSSYQFIGRGWWDRWGVAVIMVVIVVVSAILLFVYSKKGTGKP
jgi:hypothetical protein